MNYLTAIAVCWLWAAPELPIQSPTATANGLPKLVVMGFVCHLDDDEWRDARVGFGVRTLLAQALFDTGRFVNLEEKEEIRDEIRRRAETMWIHAGGQVDFAKESRGIGSWGADLAAYGRVTYFGRSSSRVRAGPLHSRTRKTIIRIEVTLVDLDSGRTITEKGVGRAKTRARSAIFTFRRDKVLWDETTIGIATREAIDDAVDELMDTYTKKW